ncbi:MAG: flagellar basal-body rod protein FlgG [Ignavibacteriales bacterium]|nr:flagellar basal-body rod protein FlgG [Ignavibacteriales bacterium]
MNRALRAATTGLAAQQMNIEIIANNLSNVNTTGFKKTRPEFQDLMYQTLQIAGSSPAGQTVQQPVEVQVGNGVIPVGTVRSFLQGDVQTTNNPLDIAIAGEGFFQIRRPDGTIAYSRDGQFKLTNDGTLVTSQGYVLEPGITIPQNTESIQIARDGKVNTLLQGEINPELAGEVELARFVNPAGLRSIGNNLYVETVASGPPTLGKPGDQGFGVAMQNQIEASNVDVVEEMVAMIVAQRAYEINTKVIKTVEEMVTMANNLKRS